MFGVYATSWCAVTSSMLRETIALKQIFTATLERLAQAMEFFASTKVECVAISEPVCHSAQNPSVCERARVSGRRKN